jgi:hypothetical protein
MRLADLNPKVTSRTDAYVQFGFQCPACRLGTLTVRCRVGEQDDANGIHSANVEPPDWDRLSLAPSVAGNGLCRRCPGWHGFITDGEIR